MSGIAGLYSLDGQPVDQELLERMLDSIAHRGKDDVGLWVNGNVSLGHRALHTTPESLREHQPLSNRDKTLWIVCDGRVDNREELMWQLRVEDVPLDDPTDAELVLLSYERWGTGCPLKVIGDYAFAIWDAREQRLFCARDPVGLRTFYYYFDGKRFHFGSEIQELYQDPTIPREINEEYIADYLAWNPLDREITAHKHITRLLHAHWLIVNRDGLRIERYWDIDPEYEIRYKTDDEYAEHFREVLREAVRCRLRSITPVAATLSGGLDSSSVVCMAQEIYRTDGMSDEGFETFSFVFDELSACDERMYIQTVADKYHLKTHYIVSDHLWAWKDVPEIVPRQDEPFLPPHFHLWKTAIEHIHKAGIRVLLTGDGGDSMLIGNGRYLGDLMRRLQFHQLIMTMMEWDKQAKQPFFKVLVKQGILPFFSSSAQDTLWRAFRTLVRRRRQPLPEVARVYPWIAAPFTERVRLWERAKAFQLSRRFASLARQAEYESAMHDSTRTFASPLDQYFALPLSIETRRPFLDRRLIEFSVALPVQQKYRYGIVKGILRRGLRGVLPKQVETRIGKGSVGPLFERGFYQEWPTIQRIFENPNISQLGYVDKNVLVQTLDEAFSRNEMDKGTMLWFVCALELWLTHWTPVYSLDTSLSCEAVPSAAPVSTEKAFP